MRVGIVSEGPTDVQAITTFLGASLGSRGVNAFFVDLQPDRDRMNGQGGWWMLLKWLKDNPPSVRIRNHFRGGLFAGGLSAKQCDVIVIQMDADVLPDEGFRSYVGENFDFRYIEPNDPIERGNLIEHIVEIVGGFDELSIIDRRCSCCCTGS